MSLDAEEVAQQYRCPDNLQARIALHRDYSDNTYNWFHWVFDHLLERFSDVSALKVLEFGCGTGQLWQDNVARIPPAWHITLSDRSQGMLDTAQATLPEGRFHFAVIDAEQHTLEPASIDVIIANHMLYHLSNVPAALAGMARVLRPQGCLFATTNGENYMQELAEAITQAFAPCPVAQRVTNPRQANVRFTLQNGVPALEQHFQQVQRYDYPDALHVDDITVLMAYVRSLQTYTPADTDCFDAAMARLEATFQAQRETHGHVTISKQSGLLQACAPRLAHASHGSYE